VICGRRRDQRAPEVVPKQRVKRRPRRLPKMVRAAVARTRQSRTLPAILAVAGAGAALTTVLAFTCGGSFASTRHGNLAVRRAAAADVEDESEGRLRRREAAGVAGLAVGIAAIGAPVEARIEGIRESPDEYVAVEPGKEAARLQCLLVSVADKEALDKEVKFWTEACKMKVLGDYDETGKKTVIVGFREAPEGSGAEFGVPPPPGPPFGIKLQLDPAIAKRPLPRLLNYDVMQPTVNPLNFIQVSTKDSTIDVFARVQASGGSSLIGDTTYLDVESPRGVAVRFVKKERKPEVVDLLSFNIEVPAFEPVVKLYQRAFGFKELKYPTDEPPIQAFSVYLSARGGGPKLLLSPVPDQRLKERNLDEVEGLLLVSPDYPALSLQAETAVELLKKEEEQKREAEKKRAAEQAAKGKRMSEEDNDRKKAKDKETQVKPEFQKADTLSKINDGLGNILFLADTKAYSSKLLA